MYKFELWPAQCVFYLVFSDNGLIALTLLIESWKEHLAHKQISILQSPELIPWLIH